MADEASNRSSFSSFFRRSKAKFKKGDGSSERSGNTPVEGDDSADAAAGGAGSSSSKHASRRAQVRSAQIRHRQRKLHYQKQLELDITEYRNHVARTESETAALKAENEAIRIRLREAGIDAPSPPSQYHGYHQQHSSQAGSFTSSPPMNLGQPSEATTPELFGNVDINDLTITLSHDKVMGTPSFNISSGSSAGSQLTSPALSSEHGGTYLTRAQEDAAINFILSLEHVCWDHFAVGDFPQHYHPHRETQQPDPDGTEGHALMATNFCMAHAPDDLYNARSFLEGATAAGSSITPAFSWQAPQLSLEHLRGLAASLNSGDIELTPVQAWFELAERYSPVALLESGAVDVLKAEFKGVVQCVAFGAAIERAAFESVVARVMRHYV